MSRLLVLGTGPLLESGMRGFSAHCLRTWHLTKPLLDAGHEILLYTLPIYNSNPDSQLHHGVEDRTFEGLPYRAFKNCLDSFNLEQLEAAAREFQPDAMLGINSYPCATLSKLNYPAPLWVDLNGSVVMESQVKAHVYGTNMQMNFFWEMEEAALRRADKFSTVSQRQHYALLGELGAVGRLNRHTFNYPFSHYIPNAYNPAALDPPREEGRVTVRGGLVPDDAFVLLWSGSYNAWTDMDVLFGALERAMDASPDLHYVSTGGPIYGHDDLSYPHFRQLIRGSAHRARYHLLGWIDADELPRVYRDANLGLTVDAANYETVFGARNRTINMMAAGVPMLTTTGAEISEEVVRANVALPCDATDAESLARGILDAFAQRNRLAALGAKGRDYVLEHFSYEATTRDLVAWAAAPDFAPDNRVKLARNTNGKNPFLQPLNPIEQRRAQLDAPTQSESPPPPSQFLLNPLRNTARRVLGPERYGKLRFLAKDWKNYYRPRYHERRAELRAGHLGKLEDLYVFLTNQCNARCKHCFYIDELGYVPGELTLEDYQRIAPTLPPLKQLTFTGGEAILHPDCREILAVLAQATRAERVTLITNGFLPAKVESVCASLLEEQAIPGVLDVLHSLDGLEATHNAIRGNPLAWGNANRTLGILMRIKEDYPDNFDFGVITIITDKNYTELEALHDHVKRSFRCRHGFEFIRDTDFSLWNLPEDVRADFNPAGVGLPPEESWDDILATLTRLNRQDNYVNKAFHLTNYFTVQMLKTGQKMLDCVSAGQNVGVLYSVGDLALCEFSKPFGNLKDYDWDFERAWTSDEANAMRGRIKSCHCTHGCYLSKNIEFTPEGQRALLTKL